MVDFDEVNIHLFPRVCPVCLRATDALKGCPDALRVVQCYRFRRFLDVGRAGDVRSFRPTVRYFERVGFERERRGEYVTP